MSVHFRDVNILAFAAQAQPTFPDDFIIAAQKKMHLAPELRELAAVVKSDRARANDGDAIVRQRVKRAHRD